MKAYKEWEKKQKNLSSTYYEVAEIAWKAALEWATEAMGQDSDSRHIWTVMQEELKEK